MVEIDEAGAVLRIFRHAKRAMELPPEKVRELPRSEAVGIIRHAIWLRCREACEYCGRTISENSWPNKMHMHEEVPKGKGGEVSLANGRGICAFCHENDPRGHADRKLQWSGGISIDSQS